MQVGIALGPLGLQTHLVRKDSFMFLPAIQPAKRIGNALNGRAHQGDIAVALVGAHAVMHLTQRSITGAPIGPAGQGLAEHHLLDTAQDGHLEAVKGFAGIAGRSSDRLDRVVVVNTDDRLGVGQQECLHHSAWVARFAHKQRGAETFQELGPELPAVLPEEPGPIKPAQHGVAIRVAVGGACPGQEEFILLIDQHTLGVNVATDREEPQGAVALGLEPLERLLAQEFETDAAVSAALVDRLQNRVAVQPRLERTGDSVSQEWCHHLIEKV